jgi:hypothetical protein
MDFEISSHLLYYHVSFNLHPPPQHPPSTMTNKQTKRTRSLISHLLCKNREEKLGEDLKKIIFRAYLLPRLLQSSSTTTTSTLNHDKQTNKTHKITHRSSAVARAVQRKWVKSQTGHCFKISSHRLISAYPSIFIHPPPP